MEAGNDEIQMAKVLFTMAMIQSQRLVLVTGM